MAHGHTVLAPDPGSDRMASPHDVALLLADLVRAVRLDERVLLLDPLAPPWGCLGVCGRLLRGVGRPQRGRWRVAVARAVRGARVIDATWPARRSSTRGWWAAGARHADWEPAHMAIVMIVVLGLALAGCGTKAATILQPRPGPAVTCTQSGTAAWYCQ